MSDMLQNEGPMKKIGFSSKTLGLISLTLALPMTLFYPVFILEVEPLHRTFVSLFTVGGIRPAAPDSIDITGVIAMSLLPVAFIVNLVPIARNLRARNSLTTVRVNLVFAAAILILIVVTWGALFVDQLPCFFGVPNCD